MKATVKAYGKINLFLDVLNKRNDGYHDVKMIMQSVRLHDIIEISQAKKNNVKTDSVFVPNNKNNLAMKAAILMQEKYCVPAVSINIRKNIPVSAGMAGGSTDAAAVLLGIDRLFNLNCSKNDLEFIAAQIGSDVPFCLSVGTAVATGRGEQITPVKDLNPCHIILIKAPFGLSTATVYQNIKVDEIQPQDEAFRLFLDALEKENTEYILNNLYNALEPVSMRIDDRIKHMKEKIRHAGINNILMSGSGPTLFGMYDSQKEAWHNFKLIKQLFPNVYLTSTCTSDLINSRIEIH